MFSPFVIKKLQEVQTTLVNERNHCMTIEEIIIFLKNVMNFGSFHNTIIDFELQGNNISLNELLTNFFYETTIEQILIKYDILQNFNNDTLEKKRNINI